LEPRLEIEFLGRIITAHSVKNPASALQRLASKKEAFEDEPTVKNFLSYAGLISFLGYIHVGLRKKNYWLQKAVPPPFRTNPAKHNNRMELTEDEQELADFLYEGIADNTPWSFVRYEKTFMIYVDGSVHGFGFASEKNGTIQRRVPPPPEWCLPGSNQIHLEAYPQYVIELKAVHLALEAAPSPCNLIIYTDSAVCESAIKKGLFRDSEFPEADALLDKIQALAAAKNIALIIRHTKGDKHNPADGPSRYEKDEQGYNFHKLEYKDTCFKETQAPDFGEIRNQHCGFKANPGGFKQRILGELMSRETGDQALLQYLPDLIKARTIFQDEAFAKPLAKAFALMVVKHIDIPLTPAMYTLSRRLMAKGLLPTEIIYNTPVSTKACAKVASEVVEKTHKWHTSMDS
jgi:hypothetical protein